MRCVVREVRVGLVASANSARTTRTYDSLNRATQAVCPVTNIPGFSTVIYKIDYAFDPVGNVTHRVITGLQGMSGTITNWYACDVMNRLTDVVQLANGAAPPARGISMTPLGGCGRMPNAWRRRN